MNDFRDDDEKVIDEILDRLSALENAAAAARSDRTFLNREMLREAIAACMARLDGEFSDLPRELELELFGSELAHEP